MLQLLADQHLVTNHLPEWRNRHKNESSLIKKHYWLITAEGLVVLKEWNHLYLMITGKEYIYA
jgi:hypothetical protein